VNPTKDFIVSDFIVSFDDYINNINIFLPELKSEYKKSASCLITTPQLDEFYGTEKECQDKCSQFNKGGTCNSFSFWSGFNDTGDTGASGTTGATGASGTTGTSPSVGSKGPSGAGTWSQSGISWGAQYTEDGTIFTGNEEYDVFMGSEGVTGKCYLYSSSPSMPKNCFIGENTKEEKPYSVYDWNDFIYSNNIASYTKDKCSIPIPIQKWTSLIITIKGLVMEIYINGKLVESFSLTKDIDNSNDANAKFIITPEGFGFDGSTLDFNYWNKCLSSQEISNLSKKVLR
jgi:hypothetical protein